jgi:hypothetical protein
MDTGGWLRMVLYTVAAIAVLLLYCVLPLALGIRSVLPTATLCVTASLAVVLTALGLTCRILMRTTDSAMLTTAGRTQPDCHVPGRAVAGRDDHEERTVLLVRSRVREASRSDTVGVARHRTVRRAETVRLSWYRRDQWQPN